MQKRKYKNKFPWQDKLQKMPGFPFVKKEDIKKYLNKYNKMDIPVDFEIIYRFIKNQKDSHTPEHFRNINTLFESYQNLKESYFELDIKNKEEEKTIRWLENRIEKNKQFIISTELKINLHRFRFEKINNKFSKLNNTI